MRNTLIITALFFLLGGNAWSQRNLTPREEKVLKIIDQELNEARRLSKQLRNKDPQLLLRMAELYLEKARFVKEKENKVYLSLPASQRKRAKKAQYFQKSRRYFQLAQKTAQLTARKHPRFKEIGEIFYILAANAKEFNRLGQETQFLEKAIQKAPKRSNLKKRAQLSLAERLYNKGQYKRAYQLYKSALGQKKSKWWTKDAFSLSLCAYQVKRYGESIRLMQEIVELNNNHKRFIDMRPQVIDNLILVYIAAGQLQRGLSYYSNFKVEFLPALLDVASSLQSKGKWVQAGKLLNGLENQVRNRSDRQRLLILKMREAFEFARDATHLKLASQLTQIHRKYPLTKGDAATIAFQIRKNTARLQATLNKKTYQHDHKRTQAMAEWVVNYLSLLKSYENSAEAPILFLQGEAFRLGNQFQKAMNKYQESYAIAIKEKSKDSNQTRKRSLMAMINLLANPSMAIKAKRPYFTSTYLKYLETFPRNQKNKEVYLKLFQSYWDQKQWTKAAQLLTRYSKEWPRDTKNQEKMVSKLIEHFRVKKDHDSLGLWASQILSGRIKVSRSYLNKMKKVTNSLTFHKVGQINWKKNPNKAIKGYLAIYRNKQSDLLAKKNAAYNLAGLYHQIGDVNNNHRWATLALKMLNPAELRKYAPTYATFSNELFLRQQLMLSSQLSQSFALRLCQTKNEKLAPNFIENASVLNHALGLHNTQRTLVQVIQKCRPPRNLYVKVNRQYVNLLAEKKKWNELESVTRQLTRTSYFWPHIITPMHKLYLAYLSYGRQKLAANVHKHLLATYRLFRKQALTIELEELDLLAQHLLIDLKPLVSQFLQIKLKFPEGVFNKLLERKLALLDQITKETEQVAHLGSGRGMTEAYRLSITAYQKFASELEEFRPKGVPKDFARAFHKSLRDLYRPIQKKARKNLLDMQEHIQKNSILSESNPFYFPSQTKVPLYYDPHDWVIMDRRGEK